MGSIRGPWWPVREFHGINAINRSLSDTSVRRSSIDVFGNMIQTLVLPKGTPRVVLHQGHGPQLRNR